MKLPETIESVSIIDGQIPCGPYPSLGFVPLFDDELGNGDCFGLYWPFGKEEFEPIICDMSHDGGIIWPVFSSLNSFLDNLGRGRDDFEEENFAPYFYTQGKNSLAANNVESAVGFFQKACDIMPEISRYWFSLATQLRRMGRIKESAEACLRAFLSNWSFGIPTDAVYQFVKSIAKQGLLTDDPIIQVAQTLRCCAIIT